MGKGSSTVTNVQQLPPSLSSALQDAYTEFNPFQQAFGAINAFVPQAFKVGTAGLSSGERMAINAAENLLTAKPRFLGEAQQNLGNLVGGAVDNTALQNQLGITADTTNLQNLLGATTDTSGITNMAGQQNAATQILSDLTTQDTNPFLQQQIDDAIGGAVDSISSQYARGGRLGSGSFADSLGAGITSAAAPILAQNLQRDRANQLAAAQALGQVSGQETQQQLNLANSLLGAQQRDLGRDATLANQLTAASEADARARLAAIGAAPGLLGADQALISQAAQLGGLERNLVQAGLDATAAQANQQNILDQNRINALLSAAGMGSGLFGQTTTQSGGGPSALSSGLGGAITGASLGGLLPAVGGPVGAAIGGGLGLLGLI